MYQTAYQTEIFGIIPAKSASAPRRPHVGPCRRLFARDCRMDGLAGKARDRANVRLTLGLEYATPFQSAAPCGRLKGCCCYL